MAQDQTPTLGMPMPKAVSAPVGAGPTVGGLPSLATVAPGTAAAPAMAAGQGMPYTPRGPAIPLPDTNTIIPAAAAGVTQDVGPTAAGLLGAAGRNIASGNVAQGVGNAIGGTALGAVNVVTAPFLDVAHSVGSGIANFARGLAGQTSVTQDAAPAAPAAPVAAAPAPAAAAPASTLVHPFGVTYDTRTGPTVEQARQINAAQEAGLVAQRGGIALPTAPVAAAPALTPFQSAMAQLPDRGMGIIPGLSQAMAGVKSTPAQDAVDVAQGNAPGTTARNVAAQPIRQGLAAQGLVQGMQDRVLAARPKALIDQMNQAEYAQAVTKRQGETQADYEARSAKATDTLRKRLILEAQNAAAVQASGMIQPSY